MDATWLRPAIVAGLAITLSGACGHDDPMAPADIIYEYAATDEAWIEVDEHAPTIDGTMAPRLTAPTTISRTGAAPTFMWEGGAVAAASPRRVGHPAAPDRFARNELFGPARARAHSPPVTSVIYRLVFTIPGDQAPARILTSMPIYTPSPAVWDRMKVATGPLSLELIGSYLTEGRVTEGPFRSAEPFTIPVE